MAVAGSAPDESAPGRGERPQEDRRRGTPQRARVQSVNYRTRATGTSGPERGPRSRASAPAERSRGRAGSGSRHARQEGRARDTRYGYADIDGSVAGHTPHGRRTPGPAAAMRRPRSALSRAARAGWSLDHPLEDLVINDDGSRGSTSRCPVTARRTGLNERRVVLIPDGYIPFPIDMIHRTMT